MLQAKKAEELGKKEEKGDYKMSFKAIFGMLLVLAALAVNASAAEDHSYRLLEVAAEVTLESGSPSIYDPTVSVSTSQVHIKYISLSSDTEEMAADIASIMGSYIYMVEEHPEVGDLYVEVLDIYKENVGSFSCKKYWAEGIDMDDSEALIDLFEKISQTIEV
jgi:hypothetical protein